MWWILALFLMTLATAFVVEYYLGLMTYALICKGNRLLYLKRMVDRHLTRRHWFLVRYFITQGKQLDSTSAYFYYMQGLYYYRQEDYRAACSEFEIAKKLQVDYWNMDNIIGDTYLQLKAYRQAKLALDHYLLNSPDNVHARLNLAVAEYYTENFEGALKLLDQALALDGKQLAAYKLKGSIYMKLRQNQEALIWFKTYQNLGGIDAQVNSQIMRIYRNLEDYESCRSYAESLLSQGHDLPVYYTHLGDALCHLGKVGKGVAMLHQALELDAHQSEAHYLLAKLMALMHRKSEALNHLRLAIADYPKYRALASEDEDFNNLRFFRDFYRLVEEGGL